MASRERFEFEGWAQEAQIPSAPRTGKPWDPCCLALEEDEIIEELLMVLLNAGLTPLAVQCVQKQQGPQRLLKALQMVFGIAISIQEPAYYFPSDLSELKGSKGPPGLVETEGECCGDGFVAERFVAESLLTSSHRSLARGKAESFSLDHRAFTKNHKGRRLSLVSEDRVHQQGTERYIVAFTSGELSRADGVGIIFSSGLPRSSDIQKIISVFLNRTGRICSRINQRVTRIAASLPQIELGDILEVVNNMELHSLTFTLWAKTGTECSASVSYKEVASAMGFDRRPVPGHLAIVVKNPGVSVSLFS